MSKRLPIRLSTLLMGVGGFACILLGLLAAASSNTTQFNQHYVLILTLNLLFMVGLAGLVGTQLTHLHQQLKQKKFGAKLTLRFVLMFALVAVVPGVMLYTVSIQFLNKSIETWFDVRLDNALDRSLHLGQTAFEFLLIDLEKKTQPLAHQLTSLAPSEYPREATRLQTDHPEWDITVLPHEAKLPLPRGVLPRVQGGFYLEVSHALQAGWILRIHTLAPAALAQDAETVERIRSEYKQLLLGRDGLKRIYTLTLTLTLCIVLLSALGLGFILSRRLSAPLNALAAGTRAVAQGDFTQRHPVYSRDELGVLTHSFNKMTMQLAEAKRTVEQNQFELETAKAYLETILANLSAGVLALDARFCLKSTNASAERILGVAFDRLMDQPLYVWPQYQPDLEALSRTLIRFFAHYPAQDWHDQYDYKLDQSQRRLLMRGSRLPHETGYLVVFDDITDLLQAQRNAAWGEVARRLAHEIRNPLTPIQLSAERLHHKLHDKLEGKEAELLSRLTNTIINQVGALKTMVDAFKEYARAPALRPERLNVHLLIEEVLSLYESQGRVAARFAEEALWIQADATLLRQVIHNLIRNAQEAIEDTREGHIDVLTEKVGQTVLIRIEDNGPGLSEAILPKIFEPYATTKQRGTGLGLAIVKKIVEEHQGQIQIENRMPNGAAVRLTLPLLEA